MCVELFRGLFFWLKIGHQIENSITGYMYLLVFRIPCIISNGTFVKTNSDSRCGPLVTRTTVMKNKIKAQKGEASALSKWTDYQEGRMTSKMPMGYRVADVEFPTCKS